MSRKGWAGALVGNRWFSVLHVLCSKGRERVLVEYNNLLPHHHKEYIYTWIRGRVGGSNSPEDISLDSRGFFFRPGLCVAEIGALVVGLLPGGYTLNTSRSNILSRYVGEQPTEDRNRGHRERDRCLRRQRDKIYSRRNRPNTVFLALI
jgi:hypothetical protein